MECLLFEAKLQTNRLNLIKYLLWGEMLSWKIINIFLQNFVELKKILTLAPY